MSRCGVRLWTAPNARGLGIARRVLQWLEVKAREAGLTSLRLGTNRALREAQALYRGEGCWEVAPNYAKQRSELAKALGLGQLRRNRAAGSGPAAQAETTPEPTKKTRGRPKRTAEAA